MRILRLALLLLLVFAGCRKDESPVTPPPAGASARYGSGSAAFVQSDSVRFAVTGRYKPSAQFAADTAGEGAGGFVHDTAAAGIPLNARFMAYSHTLRNGLQDLRLLVMTLHNDAGPLDPGTYAFVHDGVAAPGRTVSLVYESYIDSLGSYNVYESDSGAVTISVLDAPNKHAVGFFSGRLRGYPPDTSVRLGIAYGTFDIRYAGSPFTY